MFPPSPAPRSGALPSPRIPAGRNGSVLPPPTYRAAPAAAPDRSWLRFVPGTLEQRDAFRAWRRDGAPEAWSAGQDAVDELRRARDVYEERISLDALRGAIGFLRHIPGTPQRAAFLEARDSMRPVLGSALTLGVPRTDVQHLEDSRKEARETAEQSYRREISQTGAPFEPDILQRRIETAVEYAELRSPREAAEERAEYADRVRAQRRLENVPKRVLVTLGNLATRNAFMRLVTRSSASSMISVRGAGNTVATQRIIRREERRADRVRRHAEQRGFPERTASGVADFAAALAASGRTTRPVAQAEAAAPMSQALATRAARLIMNRLAQRDSNGQLIHATQTPVFEAVTGELGISRSEWADVEDMMQRLAAADAAAAAARAARFAARGSGQGGSTGGGAPQAQRSGYTGRPQTGQTGSPQVGGGQQGNASPQRGNRQGQGGGAGGSTGRSSGQSGGRQQGGSGGRGGQQTGRQGGGRASGTGGAGQGRAGGPPPRRQPSQQQPRQQP
ncbi:MAG TPA: hypothetical protein VLF91_01815 [Candidatus Saccharimonadales bacterium]|nr:hypothetical protein [Candidatus Saccharimonadales bacterium]